MKNIFSNQEGENSESLMPQNEHNVCSIAVEGNTHLAYGKI